MSCNDTENRLCYLASVLTHDFTASREMFSVWAMKSTASPFLYMARAAVFKPSKRPSSRAVSVMFFKSRSCFKMSSLLVKKYLDSCMRSYQIFTHHAGSN